MLVLLFGRLPVMSYNFCPRLLGYTSRVQPAPKINDAIIQRAEKLNFQTPRHVVWAVLNLFMKTLGAS